MRVVVENCLLKPKTGNLRAMGPHCESAFFETESMLAKSSHQASDYISPDPNMPIAVGALLIDSGAYCVLNDDGETIDRHSGRAVRDIARATSAE